MDSDQQFDRVSHNLKRLRGSKYPGSIMAVAADITYAEPKTPGLTEYRISDLCCFQSNPADLTTDEGNGWVTTPAAFLDLLANVRLKSGELWIIAADAYRLLVASGFFEQCGTDKRFALGLPPEVDWKSKSHRRKNPWRGLVVIEEECLIIHCVNERRQKIVIVSADNYVSKVDWCEYTPKVAVDHFNARRKREGFTCGTRAMREAYGLHLFFARFITWLVSHKLGSLKPTVAGQAYAAFRQRFLRHPLVVHGSANVIALERAALYGGRCEAAHLGIVRTDYARKDPVDHYGRRVPVFEAVGELHHVDATSLYSAMVERHDVPLCVTDLALNPPAHEWPDHDSCIVDATFDVPVPILPVRDDSEGLLVFPVGKFRTVVCGPEFNLAREFCRQIHAYATYATGPALKEYAQWCHEWRLRFGSIFDAPFSRMFKRWPQSCYGKFGQTLRGWTPCDWPRRVAQWERWSGIDRDTGKHVQYRSVAGRVEVYRQGGEPANSIPAITAWIASLARVWLWQAISTCDRGHVFYWDTDSLIVDDVGLSRLEHSGYRIGEDLGDLHLDWSGNRVEIYGVKHYRLGEKLVCSGAPYRSDPGRSRRIRGLKVESIYDACWQRRPPQPLQCTDNRVRVGEYRHGHVDTETGVVSPFSV